MKTIQIRTEIPGPKSRALMARREAAIPRGPSNATPVFAASADGATIEDVDGNRYLDFAGGIGCLNVGHRSPRVLNAIREQLEKHLHLCFAVTPYESYVAVAEKLNALAPGNFPKKTILLNSGAEAIENSIKIARAYTKRPAVICFEDAFHGRTLLTMSLTSKTHPYKAGFEPFASDIYRIPFAYPYRGERGATAETFAHYLEDAFKRSVAPESVAAIMDAPGVGALGGTFCGHPLSCAAALAAIETIEKDRLLARSTAIGKHFEQRAQAWQKKWPLIGEVRGLGGMCAIELVRDAQTREPADSETKAIAKYCYEHGLITITAGTFNNVIRILVPLVVTDAQLDEGLGVVESALASVAEHKQPALSHA
jgi:4-aminobutyrate aminotransferase-like enzyme